jgi:putative transposase
VSTSRHPTVQWIKAQVLHHTRPRTVTIIIGATADLVRSIAANALWRQQVVVLKRSVKRPTLTNPDRRLRVLLARLPGRWKEALFLVKPETRLDWHRQLFRLVWCRKSAVKASEPRRPAETIAVIKQMARETRLWGADRMRGELLKLGLRVSKHTIQKYMRGARPRQASGQTWTTFLHNHAKDIWTCACLPVIDLFFRQHFAFFIVELASRRVVHMAVTDAPTDAWTAQHLREATPFGVGPKYLIRDNDSRYGCQLAHVAAGANIKVLKTPVAAPNAKAVVERFLGSVRRERLDHLLVLNLTHLRRVLKEYVDYFNHVPPHQGLQQAIPRPLTSAPIGQGEPGLVRAISVLGGLHHSYPRAA